MGTKIEWSDETWNPVSGCTEVSPGCDHCYARVFAERWRGVPGHHFERGFDVTLRPESLSKPLKWRKPKRVFVNSMSDLFHKDVPDEFIVKVFDTMWCAPQHTFQVLTKRPERMMRFMRKYYSDASHPVPLANVWLGVSIESNAYAWRAENLRDTPAYRRFLSIEPMLGPVDEVDLRCIHWVIVGGESGHGARPMELSWARDLRDRCAEARIKFFFKQVGLVRAGHGKGGDDASISADLRIREFPAA